MSMNERKFDFVYFFEILKLVIFDKWNIKDFRKGIVLNDNFYEFVESEISLLFLYYLNNILLYV